MMKEPAFLSLNSLFPQSYTMPRQTVKRQRAADEDRFFADIIVEVASQPQDDDDWSEDSDRDSEVRDGFSEPLTSTVVAGHSPLATNISGEKSPLNLYPLIDRENVHGLNLVIPQLAKAIIKPWSEHEDTTIYAESDADDHMFIYVSFAQNVRVKSILLKLGRGNATPRQLRVYANYPNIIGISDAENTKPNFCISLIDPGETHEVVEYPVKARAFTNVHSLSLHFRESVGISRIYYLGFKGDVQISRKEGANKPDSEVPFANAADASITDRLA
ncbi:galactose-binding domain-like protein [Suillus paluster]|uniref:galactose-binding domain-like protein n=1 Tax=Suillus paluster TaxID=48578 RepID=UPI001B875FCB|nr:galactose-binding domain-like protein [Suillus paluster]KAG1748275.1 galactose-binding domain-like protein [Suillus paluster]